MSIKTTHPLTHEVFGECPGVLGPELDKIEDFLQRGKEIDQQREADNLIGIPIENTVAVIAKSERHNEKTLAALQVEVSAIVDKYGLGYQAVLKAARVRT